jgi:molybdate transport system permease protein
LVLTSLFVIASPAEVVKQLLSPEVLFAISLSLASSTASTALVLALAIPTAYALSRGFRGKEVVEAVLSLPNALTPVAIGAALLIFFSRTPLGSFINSIIPIVFSVPGLVVAQATVTFPLALKPLKSAMKSIDDDMILMSRTLGCSGSCLIGKVILPSIKPSLKSSTLLVFTRALSEFGASVTLAGAIRFKTETVPIAIYLNLSSGDVAKVIALITVASIMAFVLLWSTGRWEE